MSFAERYREIAVRVLEGMEISIPGIVFQCVLQPDGTVAMPHVSPRVDTLYGIAPDALETGATALRTLIHPADWEDFTTALRAAADAGDPWTWEGRVVPPETDEVRWVRLAGQSTRCADGRVQGDGFLIDVTEQKKVKAALRKNKERYRTLFENAGDAIFIMRDDTFVECNAEAIRLYGCTAKSDLVGHSPWAFSPAVQPDGQPSREKARTVVRRAVEGAPQHFYWQHLKKDGTPFDAEVTLNRIRLEDERLIQAIVRDVSASVRRQALLERQTIRLGIVNEISAAMLRTSTPEAIAEAALERLGALVPFHSASVTEYDYEAREAVFLTHVSTRDRPAAFTRAMPFAATSAQAVIETQQAVYIRDLDALEDRLSLQDVLYRWGVRSYVLVPAVIDGEVVGSLNVMRAAPRAFSEDDLSVLKEVAGLLAVSLQQARYREQLIVAKEKAEEMNRLKSTFLANMSHEIRTPLTSIIGFAELLVGMVDGEPRELLHMVQQSGHRLRETLTSVLELAELESGAKTVRREVIDVRQEVEDVLLLFEPRAREKGLTLRMERPEAPIEACADATALGRVLTNLVSNAVKFTREGSVTVRLARGDGMVEVRVEDTGIGIDPAFMPHLFDEFKQESEGIGRDYEGVGLGLSITKQLVELMRGEIEVESARGKGATFIVRLPTRAARNLSDG